MSDIEPKYQTFWPRFWAGWIDALVFAPLIWVDTLVWANVSLPMALVGWYLFYSFAEVGYEVVLHGLYGQTIGKWLMKVKVLDLSESRLSMRQAVVRDSVLIIWVLWSALTDLPDVADGINPAEATDLTPG